MKGKSTQQTEALRAPYRLRIIGRPTPGRFREPRNRRPFRAVRGARRVSKPPAPGCVLTLSNFWANSLFVLPKNEIIAESEFAAPTIIKLIPILFSTLGAFVAYNVNLVADQFQRAFQSCTATSSNRLYCFFNKRWFFDQVLNDFIVRSFLRFGYSVSFEALDKGAIEILGPYGISYTFRRLAERISQLQSGFVYHYAFAMLLGSTLFVTFFCMWDSWYSWVDNRLSFILIVSSFFKVFQE
jgi:NADH-ubiquinone oxidoreductase chain 5